MTLPLSHRDEKVKTVKLLKPIYYVLKQSGHNWNIALDTFLTKIGFVRLKSSSVTYHFDFCIFLVIYVDDIVIFLNIKKT